MSRLKKAQKQTLRGDTIIEVMMSLAIFSIIAIMTVNLMNSGVNNAQRTLEYTMARNEMDAQAEALRYLHQSYVSELQYSNDGSKFANIWNSIKSRALSPQKTLEFDANIGGDDCHEVYSKIASYKPFIINSRAVLPDTDSKYDNNIYAKETGDVLYYGTFGDEQEASVYPRVVYESAGSSGVPQRSSGGKTGKDSADGALAEKDIYNKIKNPEGIYIVAVGENESNLNKSKYYDFYIHTCWHSVGSKAASTITTIVRLYNPEVANE